MKAALIVQIEKTNMSDHEYNVTLSFDPPLVTDKNCKDDKKELRNLQELLLEQTKNLMNM